MFRKIAFAVVVVVLAGGAALYFNRTAVILHLD